MVIQRRMAVLAEAGSLAEVPTMRPDRCHAMKGDRKGQYAVDLVHPFRLAFAPDHDPLPRRADGGIDLTAVTAIVILEVVDYHD